MRVGRWRYRRYAATGRVYDMISLDSLLYRRSRLRMLDLLDPPVDATVLDLGCGTGLNFAALQAAIGPGGRIVGVDSSASMLGQAHRRVRAAGWGNVTLLQGDVTDLLTVLQKAGIGITDVDVVTATFVLSLLPDDGPMWCVMDVLAGNHPVRTGILDLGRPAAAAPALRLLYRLLAVAGGADTSRRPWRHLLHRARSPVEETHHGGHVHLTVGTYRKAHR